MRKLVWNNTCEGRTLRIANGRVALLLAGAGGDVRDAECGIEKGSTKECGMDRGVEKMATNNIIKGRSLRKNGDGNIMHGAGARDGEGGGLR